MIEGLKSAPWFREYSRRGLIGIDDCGKCMQTTPQLQRQSLGCGYEPRPDRVHLTIWQPPSQFYRGDPLTTCAGYTVNLPEVAEASIARAHWKQGALREACEGKPTEDLMNSILVFDAACSEVEHWMMTPSKDGGGGK